MTDHDPKKFYNEVMPGKFGNDYEFSRWHKNPIQHVGYLLTKRSIEKHVLSKGAPTPFRIIELGPGAGTWTKLLVGRFPDTEILAVDISREMLDRAEQAIKNTFPNAQIKFHESDFLLFDDTRRCDLFFSSRVLEYIDDKRSFTEKIAQLLTPRGKGYVITKMPHYDRDRLLGRKAQRFHTGQINPDALSGLFQESGLVVEGVYPVTVSVPFLHLPWLNHLFGKFLQSWRLNWFSAFFAESYCVVVRKP